MKSSGLVWPMRLPLCLAILFAGPWARAADAACEAANPSVKLAYSVSCGSKSECLANDQLDIKPLDPTAAAIKSVCLRFDGSGDVVVTEPLDNYGAPTTPVALTYALAPRIHRWVGDPKLSPVLHGARDGRLLLTVVLVDAKGTRYNAPLSIDLTALWTAGTLRLKSEGNACVECTFDGVVTLKVPNLQNWKQATKANPEKLVLVASGIRLPGIVPEISTSGADSTLTYRLRRVEDNAENVLGWTAVLKRALAVEPAVTFELADDKGVVVTAEPGPKFKVPTRQDRAGASLMFFVVLLVGISVLGFVTGWSWLRDSYGIPESVLSARERTFSLGRCQMFWWTLVVLVSWFTIGHATGNWLSINESALILMGISVGTAVGAVAATPSRVAAKVKALDDAKAAAGGARDAGVMAAEQAIQSDAQIRTSSILRDLLSDVDEGPGLHRLQVVVFTVFFGAAFVWLAFHEGSMPVLPATVLSLLGISGSAYVGFKMAGK
jgi:hypothetical protein